MVMIPWDEVGIVYLYIGGLADDHFTCLRLLHQLLQQWFQQQTQFPQHLLLVCHLALLHLQGMSAHPHLLTP